MKETLFPQRSQYVLFLFLWHRLFVRTRLSKRRSFIFSASLALALGSMTLLVVLAAMNGLQRGFYENIMEISSWHAQITEKDIPPTLLENPHILRISPMVNIEALASSAYQTNPTVVLIRGIDPQLWDEDPSYSKLLSLDEGLFHLETGWLVIGSRLARRLSLNVGDSIQIHYLSKDRFEGLKEGSWKIAGIISSAYVLLEEHGIFMNFHDAQMLGSSSPTFWSIKFKKAQESLIHVEKLKNLYPHLNIQSWEKLNQAFFSVLRFEKMTLSFVISFVFLIIALNLFHSLKRNLHQKSQNFALLQALGLQRHLLLQIFLFEALLIGFFGGFLGVVFGLFVSSFLNEIFFLFELILQNLSAFLAFFDPNINPFEIKIWDPQAFSEEKLPLLVFFSEVMMVFFLAILTSLSSSFYLIQDLLNCQIAQILKSEV